MKIFVIVLWLTQWIVTFSARADFAVNCKAIGGTRIDYEKESEQFEQIDDTMSLYDVKITLNPNKRNAKITLQPTSKGKASGLDPEDYDAEIVQISNSMFVVRPQLFAKPPPERVELYSIYPDLGVGFLSSVDAFMGNVKLKDLSNSNPKIPEASAKIVKFSCRGTE